MNKAHNATGGASFQDSSASSAENNGYNQNSLRVGNAKGATAAAGDANAAGTSSEQAGEALDILFEISRLMNCGVSREQLSTCMQLIELGVSPAALADIVH